MRQKEQLPWLPFDVDDWLLSRSVRIMSRIERSLYIDLLAFQWRDGSIPADLAELAALLAMPADEMAAAWARIGRQFVPVEGDEHNLVNARLLTIRQEQEHVREIRANASKENGKRGGRPRKQPDQNPSENQEITYQVISDNPQDNLNEDIDIEGDKTVLNKDPQNNKDCRAPKAKAASAANSGSKSERQESNAARLWRLLPTTHQTEEVREWLGAYFRQRIASRKGRLLDDTIDRQATEYATFTPEEIAQAFKTAALSGHTGVFPRSAQKDTSGTAAGHRSQRRPKESAKDKADRLIAEGRARRNAA